MPSSEISRWSVRASEKIFTVSVNDSKAVSNSVCEGKVISEISLSFCITSTTCETVVINNPSVLLNSITAA